MDLRELLLMISNATPWVKFVHILVFIMPIILIGSAYWLDKTENK